MMKIYSFRRNLRKAADMMGSVRKVSILKATGRSWERGASGTASSLETFQERTCIKHYGTVLLKQTMHNAFKIRGHTDQT